MDTVFGLRWLSISILCRICSGADADILCDKMIFVVMCRACYFSDQMFRGVNVTHITLYYFYVKPGWAGFRYAFSVNYATQNSESPYQLSMLRTIRTSVVMSV